MRYDAFVVLCASINDARRRSTTTCVYYVAGVVIIIIILILAKGIISHCRGRIYIWLKNV